jgi:hypothetical protein
MWCAAAVTFLLSCPDPDLLALDQLISIQQTSQHWETERPSHQQPHSLLPSPNASQIGTKFDPLFVEVIQPEQNQKQVADDNEERREKSSSDWWLVKLTGALAFIACLQTVVFWIQAGRLKSTIDAMKAVERRQLRAYVGIESMGMECPSAASPNFDPNRDEGPGFIFSDFSVISVKNFGQTPAYEVTVFAHRACTPFGVRLPRGYIDARDTDLISNDEVRISLSRFTLNSGQSEISKTVIKGVNIPIFKRVLTKEFQLFIFGRIYYKDIYGRAWRTKFCYQWEPWHPAGERFVASEYYNGEDKAELLIPADVPDPLFKAVLAPLDGSFQPTEEADVQDLPPPA